jgi:hypothetical protein
VKALDGSFIENTEAKSKDPTYIYSESAVQPVITALRQASDTASGNRPAS